jgi:hypothetical protein
LQESRFPDETNPFSQYTHKQWQQLMKIKILVSLGHETV